VKLRKRYLPVAAVLGAAVAIVPALAAGPSEAKLEVNENCDEPNWPCWTRPGGSPSYTPSVTIANGGVVAFSDEMGKAANIKWTSTPSGQPTCSSEVPVSPTPAKTGWEGKCTFEQPGTYRFESSTLFNGGPSLNYTKYEIVVEGASTGTTSTTTTTTTTISTTTTPTTTTPTTTPTTTTPTAMTSTQPSGGGASTGAVASTATTPGSMETPPAGSHPLAALALANTQHGDVVHGTVQIPAADSGARLEVELLAQGASLAKVKRPGSSRVGRLVRSSAPAGTVSFTVSLDAQAKRALRRHHKLALTVKIVLTPVHGAAVTITRSVVVR
jgi:hypothetical protein